MLSSSAQNMDPRTQFRLDLDKKFVGFLDQKIIGLIEIIHVAM